MNELDFLKLFQSQQDPSLLGQGPLLVPMQSRQTNPLPVTEAEMAKPRRLIEPKAAAPTAADPYLRQEIVASKMFSPEEEALHRDLRSKFKQSVVEGETSTQALRDMIQSTMAQDAGKIDWTPAAALAKAWGGPDVTEAVQRQGPMSAEDKLKMRMQLEKLAGDQSAKTLSEIGDYLGKVQSGRFQVEAARESSKQGRFQEGQLRGKETDLQKDLDKSVFAPMSDIQQTMGGMKDLIGKGDVSSVQQAISNFARSVAGQKGVLTDADIALVYPQNLQMKIARAQAFMTSNPNVPLPEDVKQSLLEGIQVAEENSKKVFADKIKTKKQLYSSRQSYKDVMSEGGFGPAAFAEAEKRLGNVSAPAVKGDTLGNEFDAWKKAKGY